MIEADLVSVAMVDEGNGSAVILRESGGERILVIGIGLIEASSIALELEEVRPPRPMTHDLLMGIVGRLRGRVERVLIHDLRDDVYIGQIDLMTEDGLIEVDARPSDCIALAVRARAPIMISEEVIEAAGFLPGDADWLTGDEDDDLEDDEE